jgi:two-component system CheB/CheR fusion protein
LASADRAKNEFMAMLGRELRKPLAPMRNAAEILRQSPNPDPALVSVRNMIVRQMNSMARMVDDLLDVARITGHGLDLRKSIVDLSSVSKPRVRVREAQSSFIGGVTPASPSTWTVMQSGLEQVVDSLLVNTSSFRRMPATRRFR